MNIKRASQLTGVSSTTIRYYEREGLLPTIPRNQIGVRDINDQIIRRIRFVRQMRAAGMSIKVLSRYVKFYEDNEDYRNEQLALLKKQAEIMEERRKNLQAAIDHLNWKINHFDDHKLYREKEFNQLKIDNKLSFK